MKHETKQAETKQETEVRELSSEELEQAVGGVGGGGYETLIIPAL